MPYWVYKCNSLGKNGQSSGDWREVFEGDRRSLWGDLDSLPALAQLHPGDTLLAYQTNRNELVGTARVVDFKYSEGSRHLVIRPLKKIGMKVRPLKEADSKIDRIPALQGGEIKTLYEITQSDALYLVRAAKREVQQGPTSKSAGHGRSSRIHERAAKVLENERLGAQGFQTDPAVRAAVQRHAEDLASHHYEQRGYSVHKRGKPFDLECTKAGVTFYVEVKGTQTAGKEVFLTPNEVEFARSNPMELFLLHSVHVAKSGRGTTARRGVIRIIRPWHPKGSALRPMVYSFSLGKQE